MPILVHPSRAGQHFFDNSNLKLRVLRNSLHLTRDIIILRSITKNTERYEQKKIYETTTTLKKFEYKLLMDYARMYSYFYVLSSIRILYFPLDKATRY